ncbi:hypothetical protein F7734_43215 [Scytonema sp. UIC 10036]|uniref:hypothetical protein n=1 Tax=Scytonema sp. UIC 10036 TaxID=2304196 RepID=UPI0012DAA9B4|nr:hypothetical protein [Scytonema sp. UIC 10036]MUG98744.1 hypothetical protein [Scytonema sp. UIC 10036]
MIFLNFSTDDILPKLGALIKQKRLTDCLQCLEAFGYSSESALNLLAYLQAEGVGQ